VTVTHPQGFRAAGVTAGLKSSGRPDLALVVNDGPLQVAAAVFTTNRVQAAPVRWSRRAVADGIAHAVVLNSGGANACTGDAGFADSHTTAEHTAAVLGSSAGDVLVGSTGLIGERLAMPRLLAGITDVAARLSADGGEEAAVAIMTTDTVPKTVVVERRTDGRTWSVGGMAKGSGMLAPGLATMLCVLTTDAHVEAATADAALRAATAVTFDRVDSDGCMSTNDTVVLLASGASGVRVTLALVADAEGASHDIAVSVVHAGTSAAAVAVARAVTRSNLFKAAVFGNDPNWGRVLAAVGTVPVEVAAYDADALDVSINGIQICRAGAVGEDRSLVDLATAREVHVEVDLHAGTQCATVWSNDLTHDYVHENSAYSS
jgi:glutamate N-acetyltransferase/amino-acid N-acetyltransferase